MSKKGVIIGTFVNKNNILCFIETLRNSFNINVDRIFVYSIDSNDNEYLVTFKCMDKNTVQTRIKDSRVMHVKNGCIFSINALNKLIENQYGKDKPFNEVEIDWSLYKNKLILLSNGELSIKTLFKIEDKCLFFG